MVNKKEKEIDNKIIIYENSDGNQKISVRIENETVWLTQAQISELFDTSRANITMHIKNIFDEDELNKTSVCKDFLHTANDGKNYNTKHYNLDLIISLGYRVKSKIATRFRQWATARLHEYIVKGFTMDDERLKGTSGGNYWKELLNRIRDIRSSEKALYRQTLDLYSTSIDYDAKSPESIQFFKTVQNKLHYATNKHTAAETIYTRVDAKKEFLGLTNFTGEIPIKSDISIAKNYLTKDELFRLNRLVSAFFDLAEIKAQEHKKMYMADWVKELDKFSEMFGKGTLQNVGNISHEEALKKAEIEYKKYQKKTFSPVEKAYLQSIKMIQKQVEQKVKNKD